MTNTNTKAFLGYPISFGNICTIYPPTVEKSLMTQNYSYIQKLFTLSQEEIEDMYTEHEQKTGESLGTPPTPFQYLLTQAYTNPQNYDIIKTGFNLFCQVDITILFDRKEIWLCDFEKELANNKTIEELMAIPKITEENYFDFQNKIRESLGVKPIENYKLITNERIRQMKAKERYRDRVKEKRQKGISLETTLVTICCMGIGITPLNIGKLSCAALSSLMKTYQDKEKYGIDIDMLLAGADSKKIHPKYWISNE